MVTLHIIPWILTLKISRVYKCGKSGCKGLNAEELKNSEEQIDWIVQTEEGWKKGGKEVKGVDELPWHNMVRHPDLAERITEIMTKLKDMVPPNGRVVFLFKAKCGCPFAKIQACGSQRETSTEEERIISGAALVCSICNKKYTNDSKFEELPCCHYFHKECIDNSLKRDPLCPLCLDDYVMVSSDDVC